MVTENAPPATDTTALDSAEGGAMAALFAAAVGPLNGAYYQPVFARFEKTERPGLHWNWAAALNTLNWMALRKLWGAALAYCGIWVAATLLLFGIGRLIFHLEPELELALLALLSLVSVLVPGFFGNGWLYQSSRKRVEQALASNATLPEACAMLEREAPRRSRLIAIAAFNAILASAVVALMTALPSTDQLPMGSNRMAEARNVAVGRTTDLAALPNKPASSPAATASAMTPLASAPASAPAPTVSASGIAPSAIAPTSTPVTASPASASVANAPAPVASAMAAGVNASASAPALTASTGKVPSDISFPPLPAASRSKPAEKPVETGKGAAQKATSPTVAPTSASAPKPAPAPASSTSAPSAAKDKPTGANATNATNATKAATSTATAATPTPPPSAEVRFLINVGLFADDNNARNAHAKLEDAGLPAQSTELKTSKGKRTRVRVGPFDTEAEAERAADKIKGLGLEAQTFRQ